MGVLIKAVLGGSIAYEMGVSAGDALISVNGEKVIDVLDYRFKIQDEFLLIEIEKKLETEKKQEIWELEIEKDADEDLGIIFEQPLMSEARTCRNKCVFCFVDQQPCGLRDTLYVKDDDPRLSFLTGNYVTLTNLCDGEIKRLAGYHLSPLRISVHTADMELRQKMLGNKNAGRLFEIIKQFSGIEIHFQAVICKGLNDGKHLDYTIKRLAEVENGVSLAIVPAGLTKHRSGLYKLSPFSKEEALAVIKQVQQIKLPRKFVYLADEWYITAGADIPDYDYYQDFPQLDNGVGMLRLFEDEVLLGSSNERFSKCESPKSGKNNIGIVTGMAAYNFMQRLFPDAKIFPVVNDFFGDTVNVSGLLTGGDIINQLRGKLNGIKKLFLPPNAFRSGTEDMLDGITRQDVENALGVPVFIGEVDGGEFLKQFREGESTC